MSEKQHKLLKIKVSIEYEFVGDDIYFMEDPKWAAQAIFRANQREIINEAIDSEAIHISASEINKEQDLPEGYSVACLPWMSVVFGSKTPDKTIGEILGEQESVPGKK